MLIENRKIRKILKNLGTEEIRKVPIRKKGFTGRMPKGNCHSNVTFMVCKYGGRQVVGYLVEKGKIGVVGSVGKGTGLLHHSVWENPEGKLVDVSVGWCSPDEDEIIFAVVDSGKKGTSINFPNFNFTTWFDLGAGKENWGVYQTGDKYMSTFQNEKVVSKFIKRTKKIHVKSAISLSNVYRIDEIENARNAA